MENNYISWKCPRCGIINSVEKSSCHICKTTRPSDLEKYGNKISRGAIIMSVLIIVAIIGVLVFTNMNQSSGNYNKNDPYYSEADENKDGNLSDKEWGNAWNNYLNDKYKENGV